MKPSEFLYISYHMVESQKCTGTYLVWNLFWGFWHFLIIRKIQELTAFQTFSCMLKSSEFLYFSEGTYRNSLSLKIFQAYFVKPEFLYLSKGTYRNSLLLQLSQFCIRRLCRCWDLCMIMIHEHDTQALPCLVAHQNWAGKPGRSGASIGCVQSWKKIIFWEF